MSSRMGLAVAAAAVAGIAVLVPTAAAEPTGSSTDYPSDEYGYTDSAARCDDTVVAFGRTSRALVAICVSPDGQLEYRGVRLSDQASLTMPASRGSDGTVSASNDGVTYTVTPDRLLVSDGDNVLYRDAWIEFREPGFAGASSSAPTETASGTAPETPSETPTETTTETTTQTPTATPTSTAAVPPTSGAATSSSSPTVSTTTVTLTPAESN